MLFDFVIITHNSEDFLTEFFAQKKGSSARSVVVSDFTSSDHSIGVARDHGAIVLPGGVGYGAACLKAIAHLATLPTPPEAVLFLSGDSRSDLDAIEAVLAPIRQDRAELVLTTRPRDLRSQITIRPFLKMLSTLYRADHSDISPMRAVRFAPLVAMGMRAKDDSWDLEMQIKGTILGLQTREVPTQGKVRHMPSIRFTQKGMSSLYRLLRHSTMR